MAIDLETILDGNLYNEFALVFRLLHRSRLPADRGDPHECLLETWYQQGIDEGGRVRDHLRDGVKAALETLGSGFLGHPANAALRAKLDEPACKAGAASPRSPALPRALKPDLSAVVSDGRGGAPAPVRARGQGSARHEVYLRWYGIGRLRDRAERRAGEDGYGDLWEGLKETFRLFRDEAAAKALALTALNGELFGHDACFDLEDRNTALRNSDLLDAIRQLSTFEERTRRKKTGVQRRVNYAGLDVEELGSIYESLLDYHPQVLRDPWRFALTAGSQRKETGSYYTPPELVRELIESALVPVMEARRDTAKTKEEKERALLSLTICDPAAGSGHFLLAAARRVGRELAIIRSGEAEPAPETYRAALRDVIRHCLYAVDKNPLAVDLCKVALWIEGHSAGLPLSFLDHRIRCGDSLVGVFGLDVLKAGVPDDAFKRLTGDDKAVCSELRGINRRDRGGKLEHVLGRDDPGRARPGIRRACRDARRNARRCALQGRTLSSADRERTGGTAASGLQRLDGRVFRLAQFWPGAYSANDRRCLERAHRPRRSPPRGADRRAELSVSLLSLATAIPGGVRARRVRRDARQSAVGADQASGKGILRRP